MKEKVARVFADIALGVTKANVNSDCGWILYQRKLPKNSAKLKK